MRIIAPMMILIMMTSTLAGCTGGDPDGGGNDEIDMDILNQLIDDNLQDFINNTTIIQKSLYYVASSRHRFTLHACFIVFPSRGG